MNIVFVISFSMSIAGAIAWHHSLPSILVCKEPQSSLFVTCKPVPQAGGHQTLCMDRTHQFFRAQRPLLTDYSGNLTTILLNEIKLQLIHSTPSSFSTWKALSNLNPTYASHAPTTTNPLNPSNESVNSF